MIGVYFSGTGNTKYCLEMFLREIDQSAKCLSIEDGNVLSEISQSDIIVFAYPIYFSNLPKIVRDFIDKNKSYFAYKKIFIIATMGLFSGDGAGVGATLLRKYKAKIAGGLHLKMPDCIGDEKALKRPLEQNKLIIRQAETKIIKAAKLFKKNCPPQEGLNFAYHMAGLFGQRLWFYNKTRHYSDKLKISLTKCVGCGLCVQKCPMNNLVINNCKAQQKGKCTMCYRCISNCPKQAITLLGNTIYEQCKIENYI